MQFRDLKAQYSALKNEIDVAMQEVVNDCNFISGRQVNELEEMLAEYVGTKHCVTCGNGTDALTMMMMAWDIKEGDAVFVPDFTFFASGEVVSFEGATPVFYDVRKDTFNADVESLEKAICATIEEAKLNPRAIIAVDLFGLPANYPEIEKVAKKYNLLVLEDGAQGFGGRIGNRKACSFGDAATTSFFPAKPLGCYGDGGAIFTNDDQVADYLKSIRVHGRKACSFGDAATTSFFPAKPLGCYGDGGAIFTNDDQVADYLKSIRVHGKGTFKYDNIRIGWNSRLDTLQAAILKVKFDAFVKYELDSVNQAAAKYTKALSDIVITPVVPENYYSSWAQYTIQLKSKEERDGLQQYLKENGIPSMVYYPKPMHEQLAFDRVESKVALNNTEQLCDTVLSVPMHPYLDLETIQIVCKTIKEYLS